jgi:predicted oxidoreductase
MKTDIRFSPLIVGTMRLGSWGVNMTTDELERFIDACVDLGLTDFDHADIYGHYTEEGRFGQVLARRPDLKSKIQLTTKCGIKLITPNRPDHKVKSYDSTAKHILASAERSLIDLNVDHIDLLLIHRPDFLMDATEIADSFKKLHSDGKVKYFGVSNFTPDQFELLHAHIPLVTNQVEASVAHTQPFEDGTITQCQRLSVTPTIWSPLGGGKLFSDPTDECAKRVREVVSPIQEKYQCQFDQLLLAWLMKHPAGLVPVLGTTKMARIQNALEATKLDITHEEWYAIWQAGKGEEVA